MNTALFRPTPLPLHRGLLLGMVVLAAGLLQAQSAEELFPMDTTPVGGGATPPFTSYADVLDPVREAVVSVTTASIVEVIRGRGTNPMEEFLRRFYGLPPSSPGPGGRQQQQPETFERRVPNGLGSGVIISADGYILTNNHVISDNQGRPADEIKVHLNDGTQLDAVVVGRDERTDVALIKIERTGLPFIRIADSNQLRVGDIVFAIGNPLGIGQTCTMGIVSATGRSNLGLLGSQGYENFIQTDAAINRGNSGGALVDARGRLVGINTAIVSQTGGNIGIGFAIPSRLARSVVLELIETGKVRRGYLGVSISDLNPDMAEAFGLDSTRGALVENVQENTPAAAAGIKRGDVIRTIDGQPVQNVTDLRLTIAGMRPGTEVEMGIFRDGENLTLRVVLGSLDDPSAVATTEDSPLEGIALEPLNATNRQQWNTEEERGLIITEVNPRSPYANVLAPGMVILEVNDVAVNTIGELGAALRSGRVNKLWVSFRGNRGFLALRVR